MAAFLYQCPITNQPVQCWAEDHESDAWQPVQCLACQRTHLVDPKTGEVMGADLSAR
jgi:hypothetical protein